MTDPRVRNYAELLVDRCVEVQPGWQVLITAGVLARPLVEEVQRAIARRGAYALTRVVFEVAEVPTRELVWALEAPEELLAELPAIERQTAEQIDAHIAIIAPENTRAGSRLSPERQALLSRSRAPIIKRYLSHELAWVGCDFPCPALAQDAGMSLAAFEDFLYGACLLDWEEEGRRMRRIADRFDAAEEVRIVGAETDVRLSLTGRQGRVDAGRSNMPGGEIFYSPVEDSAEGVVTFSEYPACAGGFEVEGVCLRFEGGRVVEASARTNEDFLLRMLDTDAGARGLGELGIGCNPRITRHLRNTLFDEKIYGTVHLAVGASFPDLGGRNESSVHWDMVKELRGDGEIHLDGELVQRDGEWVGSLA